MPQTNCKSCGSPLPEGKTVCSYCGTNNETNFGTTPGPNFGTNSGTSFGTNNDAQSSASVNNTDPNNTNTFALVGMISGIVSTVLMPLIFCSCIPANVVMGIVPIVFGVLGLNYIKKNPGADGKVQSWVGIGLGSLTVLVGILSTVITIILLIASSSV